MSKSNVQALIVAAAVMDKPWRKYDVAKDPHQDNDLNAGK